MSALFLMFAGLIVALVAGLPIAVALGGVGLIAVALLNPMVLAGAAHAVWNSTNSYTLVAVPLFILMGNVIQRSELSLRFYRAVVIWLRWLPGGLLHAAIAATGVFSAISGSSVATAATIGAATIPDLKRLGYNMRLSAGTLAAGGTLGILIPPSVALIIYGALAEVSVGKLFLAGVIPGIAYLAMFSFYILVRSLLNPQLAPPVRTGERIPAAERLHSVFDMLPVLLIMILVLLSIYLGWATPTEVAAVGSGISILVGFVLGRLTMDGLRDCITETVRFTSMILFVIVGAQIFSYALFSWNITHLAVEHVLGSNLSPHGVLAIIVGVYLVLGLFIDAISMMILTLGVVYPIITNLGFDPIWFGIVLVILLEIGLISPPVGMNLYTIRAMVPEQSLTSVALGSLPFVVILLSGVVILVLFPEIALWLPNAMKH
ncbi:MAG: TRAP transporter large permease subunit [Anaerolineales bacterium]|nr:TRAP transporter large permease subunit [Anaerolineales bacterium]